MRTPLVSVVCLCYNQAPYVEEAVRSVLRQSYPSIELLVVDDASTDGSAQRIESLGAENSSVKTLLLKSNLGHCKAFNQALKKISGDYVIDLAADDVLLPDRVATGVAELEKLGPAYGVHFSDAEWIDENGQHLFYHSEKVPHHTVPSGDIYLKLIKRSFMCPPTLLFRRSVLEALGGYDESLSYEDFDFWIRSSRAYRYTYTPAVLVKKRVVPSSTGKRQFSLFSRESATTFRVCEKIMNLNRTRAEQQALSKRILYEMRLNARLLNMGMVSKYLQLWIKNRKLVLPE
jgi:glycosyltransferase involved in cell wall biosynthesis